MALGGPSHAIRRIAVLRGGGLGDLVFAVPALRALAARFANAEIVLVGRGWQAGVAARPRGPVTAVIDLPQPVIDWLAGGPEPPELDDVIARLDGRFDLAVQIHGGGARSNLLVGRLGAARTIGLRADGAPPLDATIPYRYWQSEVMRALEVVRLAGAEPVEIEPRLVPTAADIVSARRVVDAMSSVRDGAERVVVLAPGATDGRRRWPAPRFGELARALGDEGHLTVVIGTEPEAALASDIARAAPGPSI